MNIIYLYNNEQSQRIFEQNIENYRRDLKRIREMIMDKEVLKIQAGLNFYFEKIAPLREKTKTKPERLICDGVIGPKTIKAIEIFKSIAEDVKYKEENNKFNAGDLFDANEYYCQVNSDFDYISQRNSKHPNQLCSAASMCMILSGFGFDISVDELNDFIDSDEELAKAAIKMGFGKYVELKKIEQVTAIMVMVLSIFGINAEMIYLTKEQIIEEMHTRQVSPNKKRIIFATSLTQSGHYVVGNYLFKKFAGKSFEISVYDPFGNWHSNYKDFNGKTFFSFDEFLSFCKTDGSKDRYRCIIFQ